MKKLLSVLLWLTAPVFIIAMSLYSLGITGKDNVRQATQEEYANMGFTYTGPVVNGQFTGEGILDFNDGTRYTGGFSNGRFQGAGQLYSPSGRRYEGFFENGAMTGEGTVHTDSGQIIYTGGFKSGLFDGWGTYTAPDDSFTYTGSFVSGHPEGYGVYRGLDGIVYEGFFKNGGFSIQKEVQKDKRPIEERY